MRLTASSTDSLPPIEGPNQETCGSVGPIGRAEVGEGGSFDRTGGACFVIGPNGWSWGRATGPRCGVSAVTSARSRPARAGCSASVATRHRVGERTAVGARVGDPARWVVMQRYATDNRVGGAGAIALIRAGVGRDGTPGMGAAPRGATREMAGGSALPCDTPRNRGIPGLEVADFEAVPGIAAGRQPAAVCRNARQVDRHVHRATRDGVAARSAWPERRDGDAGDRVLRVRSHRGSVLGGQIADRIGRRSVMVTALFGGRH